MRADRTARSSPWDIIASTNNIRLRRVNKSEENHGEKNCGEEERGSERCCSSKVKVRSPILPEASGFVDPFTDSQPLQMRADCL
jgi:hypothetical protein